MSDNLVKYNQAFEKVFGKNTSTFDEFVFKQTSVWDSVAQIALVSAIEDAFEIELDFEDIFSLNSFKTGKILLDSKFGIKF